MGTEAIETVSGTRDVSLVEVLDRVINTGVVLEGDLTLSMADVDLIYLGVRLILCSVDRLGHPTHSTPKRTPLLSEPDYPDTTSGTTAFEATPAAANATIVQSNDSRIDCVSSEKVASLLPPPKSSGSHPERGLAQLVLTLVELLRQLLERQAIRRMENETITDDETERIGRNLMALEHQMEEFKRLFDLTDKDLNLDLGPFGHLLD